MKMLFFLFATILVNFTHYTIGCMLPPTPFKPAYIQAHNPELDKWRTELYNGCDDECKELLNNNKNIKCIDLIKKDASNVYRCFQYAIETITGYNGYISFPDKGSLSIDLARYFQQTPYLKKNNLIMYTTSEQDRIVHHFAVAINRIRFKSKSGARPEVYEHSPFDLTAPYGKTAWSFELRPEYQGLEGQKRLLEDMKIDLSQKHITLFNQKYWTFLGGFGLGAAYAFFLMFMSEKYLVPYLKSR